MSQLLFGCLGSLHPFHGGAHRGEVAGGRPNGSGTGFIRRGWGFTPTATLAAAASDEVGVRRVLAVAFGK